MCGMVSRTQSKRAWLLNIRFTECVPLRAAEGHAAARAPRDQADIQRVRAFLASAFWRIQNSAVFGPERSPM